MILWALYAWWGIQAIVSKIPTIDTVSSNTYGIIWAGSIALFSLIALCAAISVYFVTKFPQVLKKRIELYAVIVLLGFIAVYPLSLTVLSFHGDISRQATTVLAYSYLVFPLLRVRHLNRRIKQYVISE
jgi:hypothetical protein